MEQNCYASSNITIGVIKSSRMKWAGHVARMGEMINAYKTLVEKPEGKGHSEDIFVGGRIILELILG
jgi:hypothetical protein